MGRTTPAYNAINTDGGEATQSFNAAQGDVGQYNKNMKTLDSGQDVGADPFKSTGYLSNVNKLQSEALNGAADSGKAEMARSNMASGGLNSSQMPLAQRDVSLQTGRLADTLSAARSADDYKSNLQYQQYLAQAPLQAAGAEQGLYGTAMGGQGTALNAYTSLQNARYGFYGGMVDAALSGAGTGAGMAAACWIAEALYGEDDSRTHLLRSWLNDEFSESRFGRAVMKLYCRFGQRIAKAIRVFRPLGWLFRPVFELGLYCASRDRQILLREAF